MVNWPFGPGQGCSTRATLEFHQALWFACASWRALGGWTAGARALAARSSQVMSVLCVARWRSARNMIDWMCSQERWNPEVAIIFGAAAHCRRAKAGSSHNDARPDNSTLHTGADRPHTGFVGSFFFILPSTGHGSSQVFEMLLAFSCIS